jgi:hypothetical protein
MKAKRNQTQEGQNVQGNLLSEGLNVLCEGLHVPSEGLNVLSES